VNATRVLRPYQKQAITYVKGAWAAGFFRPPAVAATGLGKTEIFTDPTLLDEFLDIGKRVLIIAHTDELIEQAAKKARRNNPGRRVGIVKGQEYNQITADIIVSSRQTMRIAGRRSQVRNVGLIVIDECHHAVRNNSYGQILEHFGAFEEQPSVRVVGFTATLARGDRQKLSTIWEAPDGKPFVRDILFGIRHGYLLDVRGKRVVVPDFNVGNVKVSGGDFNDSSMAEELERVFAPEIIAKAYLEHAVSEHTGRLRRGIAFWPLIDTAYHGAKAFNEAGIRSEVVHGDLSRLSKKERRAVLRRLHTGETLVVHSVDALNEGFDEPLVDVAVLAGPTRSAPRYQQRAGRVLRPNLEIAPELREKALLLDCVGAGARNDLRSLVDLAPERMDNVTAEDGDSLLEIDNMLFEVEEEQELRGAGSGDFAEDYTGPADVVEFDPLGRSTVWSQTPAGAWFMSAGSVGYVFLAPSIEGDPAHYDVVTISKFAEPTVNRAGEIESEPWTRPTEHTDLPLDMALGWAEEVAIELGGHGTKTLTGRKSAWRKLPGTEPKYEKLRRLAAGLGVYQEGMTAGEMSDAVSNIKAARRIDPIVRWVQQKIEKEMSEA